MANHNISVTINGAARAAEVESRLLLVHFIRENTAFDRHPHRL